MSEPLVIVGQGMAATRLVDELTQRALGRYSIIVIGAEPRRAYNRVLLSSLLAGEVSADDIELKSAGWWQGRGVTNVFGQSVFRIDRTAKCVVLENGRAIPYSRLVLATGSDPIMLPKPGMDLPGVIAFRRVEDVDALLRAAGAGKTAVVIGGGLLGIEAAYGLARAGTRVTLVHLMDRLMERQLDPIAGAMLRKAVEERGVDVVLHADTECVLGQDHAEGLKLTDGRVFPAETIVCAIGIKARSALAREADLDVKRGIIVDDQMITSDPCIAAIGECAEHRGNVYGLVEPAYEQARVLARQLCGDRHAAYTGSTLATNLKVSGVPVFSVGDFTGGPESEILIYEDAAGGIYKKFVIEGDRLMGAVLFGDTADALWYLDLVRTGNSIGAMRETLAFGRDIALPQAA